MKSPLLLLSTILLLISCQKNNNETPKDKYLFNAIDIESNKPMAGVKMTTNVIIGNSYNLQTFKGTTDQDGVWELPYDIPQDSIEMYYDQNPNAPEYFGFSFISEKDGYSVSQLVNEDEGLFYFRRANDFKPNTPILVYMYENVDIKIDFEDTNNIYQDMNLDFVVLCYPKHPNLKYNTYEYKSTFAASGAPKNFSFDFYLAPITYDVEVAVLDAATNQIVYKQTQTLDVSKEIPSQNLIKIGY